MMDKLRRWSRRSSTYRSVLRGPSHCPPYVCLCLPFSSLVHTTGTQTWKNRPPPGSFEKNLTRELKMGWRTIEIAYMCSTTLLLGKMQNWFCSDQVKPSTKANPGCKGMDHNQQLICEPSAQTWPHWRENPTPPLLDRQTFGCFLGR